MATDQAQRPRFFEGQFLGADDLAATVDYARFQQARHRLGGHTWGIAVGLHLRETENLSGGIDVTLEPGYAVDGFGRALFVTTRQFIDPARIATLNEVTSGTQGTVQVPVWLRYREDRTQGPAEGFAVCENGDQRARFIENFEILYGRQPIQKDDLNIAGAPVAAVEGLRTVKTDGPLLCDESVPFQVFPDNDNVARWLIPLGVVHWDVGTRALIKSDEAALRATRHTRRYIGVVAETVNATDGIIRLRNRTTPPGGSTSLSQPCDDQGIQQTGNRDLTVASGVLSAVDLVWVEGNLRVVGDGKLFGGKLSFHDAGGDFGNAPMEVRRVETNSFAGGDLQVLIGKAPDAAKPNRLVIGSLDPPDPTGAITEHVMMYDDGKVGIGTFNPTNKPDRPLTIRGLGGDGELISFEDNGGVVRWHINQMADVAGLNIIETVPDTSRLFLKAGGNVGIGATDPLWPLTVRAADLNEELMAFEVPDGSSVKWHINQNLGGNADGLNFAETGVANGRLFLKAGGNVGIGTTAPLDALHVAKPGHLNAIFDRSDLSEHMTLVVGSAVSGLRFSDTNEFIISSQPFANRNDGSFGNEHLRVRANGDVGIGTPAPLNRLHVAKAGHLNAIFDHTASSEHLTLVVGGAGSGLRFSSSNEFFIASQSYAARNTSGFGNEHLRIKANGDVGIGTSAPEHRLQIGDASSPVSMSLRGPDLNTQSSELAFEDNNGMNGRWFKLVHDTDNNRLTIRSFDVDPIMTFERVTGNVGVGTPAPVARLHVQDSLNEDASSLSAHVAVIENTSTGGDADVLALKVGTATPGGANNFITFFRGNTPTGAIEGAGAAVVYKTSGADYAEALPRLREDEHIEAGDLVGVHAGRITRATDGAHHVMAITSSPAVVGNRPPEAEAHRYEKVAFLGQVPVKVRGPVRAGDFIVPSGLNDGVGRAVAPDDITGVPDALIVGRAWESSQDPDIKLINAAIGLDGSHTQLLTVVTRQEKEIEALRSELDQLKATILARNGLSRD